MKLAKQPLILDWMNDGEIALRRKASTDIKKALKALDLSVKAISFFQDGHSSVVALVTLEDRQIVVKQTLHENSLVQNEVDFYNYVSNTIKAPNVLFTTELDGRLFIGLDLIKAKTFRECENDNSAKKSWYFTSGVTLGALHSMPINEEMLFENEMVDLTGDATEAFAFEINHFKEVLSEQDINCVQQSLVFLKSSGRKCLIHGDIHTGNMFISNSKEIILFDPYPVIQHPALEIGRYVTSLFLQPNSIALIQLMLEGYRSKNVITDSELHSGIIIFAFIKLLTCVRKNEPQRFERLRLLFNYYKAKR